MLPNSSITPTASSTAPLTHDTAHARASDTHTTGTRRVHGVWKAGRTAAPARTLNRGLRGFSSERLTVWYCSAEILARICLPSFSRDLSFSNLSSFSSRALPVALSFFSRALSSRNRSASAYKFLLAASTRSWTMVVLVVAEAAAVVVE